MRRELCAAMTLVGMFLFTAVLAQNAPAETAIRPALAAVKIFVMDMDRSEHFYREVFGLGETQKILNERVFALPGGGTSVARIALVQADHHHEPGSFGMYVADAADIVRRATAAGSTAPRPMVSLGPSGNIGFITDPDGTLIELIQLAR
jgi:predicted enzyme related to lactoylglutathione lyase